MRIVLDTNALLVSIAKKSMFYPVFQGIFQGKFILCVSNEIITEYEEIIAKKTTPEIAENILNAILDSPYIEKVEIFYNFNLIYADPDDNKFVDCAISAGVKYIVSNDKHYNILKSITHPKVDVMKIEDFLIELEKSK